jgi:hypothetical protein
MALFRLRSIGRAGSPGKLLHGPPPGVNETPRTVWANSRGTGPSASAYPIIQGEPNSQPKFFLHPTNARQRGFDVPTNLARQTLARQRVAAENNVAAKSRVLFVLSIAVLVLVIVIEMETAAIDYEYEYEHHRKRLSTSTIVSCRNGCVDRAAANQH